MLQRYVLHWDVSDVLKLKSCEKVDMLTKEVGKWNIINYGDDSTVRVMRRVCKKFIVTPTCQKKLNGRVFRRARTNSIKKNGSGYMHKGLQRLDKPSKSVANDHF